MRSISYSSSLLLASGVPVDDAARRLSFTWDSIREPVIVPILGTTLFLSAVMWTMLFVERVYLTMVIMYVQTRGMKWYTRYWQEEMKEDIERTYSCPSQRPCPNSNVQGR